MTAARYALMSLTNKTGAVELARQLAQRGWKIVSTGGTAKHLTQSGLEVIDVSTLTGFAEIMDGRVKTLHPKVHAGILADRDNPDHMRALVAAGAVAIDLVAVNLYNFADAITGGNPTVAEAIEHIDIGGPAMLRAAAKNHRHTLPVIDPADYPRVIQALDGGGPDQALRQELAAKTFSTISSYDRMIADWLAGRTKSLRYGENPHQGAIIRADAVPFRCIHGKELSYNNFLDLDAACNLAQDLVRLGPAAVITKHASPCGAALSQASTGFARAAFEAARATDPVSAFGGIVAFNCPVDLAAAESIGTMFLECIAAPAFDDEARLMLERKKDLRLVIDTALASPSPLRRTLARSVRHGQLEQHSDEGATPAKDWKLVTPQNADVAQLVDLEFAWIVAKHVKSNALVFARQGATLAIGGGQTSRVDAGLAAVERARRLGIDLNGSVLASDGFFPFRDVVDLAAKAGVRAIVQPGGSKRDQDSIDAAGQFGIPMYLTGMRHFRH